MADQIGTTREYTDTSESTDSKKKLCPVCQVYAVPRGITTTAKINTDQADSCPNCGHVYGRNSLLVRKVRNITVTGAGGANTITVDGGTLQLTATILPDYADDPSVAWSSSDETIATVDSTGLVTAIANGTATITATANDGSGVNGWLDVTTSNQV